jgi:hypothetical protein
MDSIKNLSIERRNLLNLLRTLVSENIYICGHGSMTNPNVVLAIQVSARIRALLGLNLIDQHCLRIAAVYNAISYTVHEQQVIKECSDAVRVLLSINPNYVGEMIDINQELWMIPIERSRLTGFSHNVNEFFIIEIHADGTLHYVYFF